MGATMRCWSRAWCWLLIALAALCGCESAKPPAEAPAPTREPAAEAGPGQAAGDQARLAAAARLPDWVHLDSASCAACHQAIVDEWKTSMHALSMAETDPLYDLMAQRAKHVDPVYEDTCRGCHYPPWWRDAAQANVVVEGVSCVVCHKVSPKHPEALADGSIAVFAQTKPGIEGANGLCLSCHDALKNAEGQPVCTTGPEAADAAAGSCVECHMPRVDGPGGGGKDGATHIAHTFPGGHDPAFVQQAVSLEVHMEGAEIVVDVTPVDMGHAVPTGTPMRYMALRIESFDADDALLWENIPADSLPLQDSQALFMRVFSDEKGNKPVPPFVAKGAALDLRLEPARARTVRYPLPEGTAKLDVTLEYGLAPEKLLEAAGAPLAWRERILVASASLDLTAPPPPPTEEPLEEAGH